MNQEADVADTIKSMVEKGKLYYLRLNNSAQRTLHVKPEARSELKALNIITTKLPLFDALVNQASLSEAVGGAAEAIKALQNADLMDYQSHNALGAQTEYLKKIRDTDYLRVDKSFF